MRRAGRGEEKGGGGGGGGGSCEAVMRHIPNGPRRVGSPVKREGGRGAHWPLSATGRITGYMIKASG